MWRDNTLSEPVAHSFSGATGTHAKGARRNNPMEMHRPLRVAVSEPGNEAIARDTEAGRGVQSPMGMEETLPKRDSNRPVMSRCASGHPKRQRLQLCIAPSRNRKAEADPEQNSAPHDTLRRKCGRERKQKQVEDVQCDTKTRTERRGDCRRKRVCGCGGTPREGRRESDTQVRVLRDLRERKPCKGERAAGHTSPEHHDCGFGGPHTTCEAPIPGPSCNNVAKHVQFMLTVSHHNEDICAELFRESMMGEVPATVRSQGVNKEVEEQRREESSLSDSAVL